jgi:hypothetical protein
MRGEIFGIGVVTYGIGFLLLYIIGKAGKESLLFLGPLFIIAGLILIPVSILLAEEKRDRAKRPK